MGFKFPRASDTVEAETTFGKSPNAGTKRSYSRGDHTHGTPTAAEINRLTVFGANDLPADSYGVLGYLDYTGVIAIPTQVRVPSGRTFRLWALGKMYVEGNPLLFGILAWNETTGQIIREMPRTVDYEYYTTPYTAQGACVVGLRGHNTDPTAPHVVSGYMLFSIE